MTKVREAHQIYAYQIAYPTPCCVSLLVTDSDTATVKRKRARQEHVQISVSNYNTLT